MHFEWDSDKAAVNLSKHGVSFEEASTMAKADPEMRDEYDFSNGVRGKYAERFRRGSNVVVLAPDVAKRFHTSKDVNDALRRLGRIGSKAGGRWRKAR